MQWCKVVAVTCCCVSVASFFTFVLLQNRAYSFLLFLMLGSITGVCSIMIAVIGVANWYATRIVAREQPTQTVETSYEVMIEMDEVIKIGRPTENQQHIVIVIEP